MMNNDAKKLASGLISIAVSMVILLVNFRGTRYLINLMPVIRNLPAELFFQIIGRTLSRQPLLIIPAVVMMYMGISAIRCFILMIKILLSANRRSNYGVHTYRADHKANQKKFMNQSKNSEPNIIRTRSIYRKSGRNTFDENYTRVSTNDKDRYVRQLDTLLHSGIINRDEYRRLLERYNRRQ